MRFILFLFFSFFCLTAKTEDPVQTVLDTASLVEKDPDLDGLQWNRYVNGNFTILSIDDRQGAWLNKNINKIFDSCSVRWGLEPIELKQECRIFCVPNQKLLKKLFNLDKPKSDIRKNEDNSISINVIWVCMEEFNKEFLFPYLTHISFSGNRNYPFWFARGSELLGHPVDDIVLLLKGPLNNFLSCEEVLSLSNSEYLNLTEENKDSFDKQSILLCMMLRKELGQFRLVSLLNKVNGQDMSDQHLLLTNFKIVYGYRSLEDLNLKYRSYCNDLLKEISSNKVPNSYFLIKEVK